MMAAGYFEAPELVLDERDAKLIAEAIIDVGEQYTVTIDPKMAAWGKLAAVLLGVYGGRAMRIHARKKSEQRPQVARPSSAEVFNFSPGSGVMPPQ